MTSSTYTRILSRFPAALPQGMFFLVTKWGESAGLFFHPALLQASRDNTVVNIPSRYWHFCTRIPLNGLPISNIFKKNTSINKNCRRVPDLFPSPCMSHASLPFCTHTLLGEGQVRGKTMIWEVSAKTYLLQQYLANY